MQTLRTLRSSLALWLALAIALLGCSPSPPTLRPKSVVVKNVTVAGLEVELGEVTVDSSVKLPANKHTEIVVPMTFSWTSLVEIGLLAARQSEIPFTVEGIADVGGKSFHVEVPFTIEGTLTRAQLALATARSLPKLGL